MMTDRELMQQALRYMESIGEMDTYPEDWAIAVALRERLAQPEQEPVVYMYPIDFEGIQKTQTHAEVMTKEFANLEICIPLYAAPRSWQGLTDEERGQIINANFGTGLWQMAKDLEAKLKEKNNG